MNEEAIQNYKKEILNLFRKNYATLSVKGPTLEFQTVLLQTLSSLGVTAQQIGNTDFLKVWYSNIHQGKFLQQLIKDSDFQEIIIHSNEKAQRINSLVKDEISLFELTASDYQLALESFALKNNMTWNTSSPFVSFLAQINGINLRVTLIHASLFAENISKVFLRTLQDGNPSLKLFNLPDEESHLLKTMIAQKNNILISGSTGSGKTTLMRALLNEISKEEHVVILEDTHEILPFSPFCTSLISDDKMKNKSLKDYCSYALRMSPDRIIIGEMRSSEVVPFMLAMNTGHKGLISSIHANSGVDALFRIALLFSLYSENREIQFNLIMKLVCKNIDYIIHMDNKKIKEICRIIGSEDELPIYEMIYDQNWAKAS